MIAFASSAQEGYVPIPLKEVLAFFFIHHLFPVLLHAILTVLLIILFGGPRRERGCR
jgi:hypothetical protein